MSTWQRIGAAEERIASVMISGCEGMAGAVRALFAPHAPPYAGIIASLNEGLEGEPPDPLSAPGQRGFVFLYRAYTRRRPPDPTFPVAALVDILETVAYAYAQDVLALKAPKVSLDACWAVCQHEGDYGTLHNHIPPRRYEGALYSGMLTLDAPPIVSPGTPAGNGLHLITASTILDVPVRAHSVCLWPANVVRDIHPFRGPGDRLGVAFNTVIS
jgi:hypothetical protein